MQMQKIPDLAWAIDGTVVRLEQDAGMGDVVVIDLHPMHVRLLASELGLLKGDPDAWRRVEILERRLRLLAERIAELDDRLWAVPVCPPGSRNDDPDLYFSDATRVLAAEFVADLPAAGERNEPVPVASAKAADA